MTDRLALLRDELAKPAYAGMDDMAAAVAIEALRTGRARSFAWREARGLAQRLGRWPWVVARSRQTPQLPLAGLEDAVILAAIGAVEMNPEQIVDPADADTWRELQQGLEVLVAGGDLTAEVAAAILALGSEQVPLRQVWGFDAPISYTDIEAARALV